MHITARLRLRKAVIDRDRRVWCIMQHQICIKLQHPVAEHEAQQSSQHVMLTHDNL